MNSIGIDNIVTKLKEDKFFASAENLTALMFQAPQIVVETRHHFSKGLYAREVTMLKGSLVAGKIHKHEHLNIVSKGKAIVATQEGVTIVEAPATLVSPPGTQRVLYVLEDMIWTCLHATEETDLKALEDYFVATTRRQYLDFTHSLKE